MFRLEAPSVPVISASMTKPLTLSRMVVWQWSGCLCGLEETTWYRQDQGAGVSRSRASQEPRSRGWLERLAAGIPRRLETECLSRRQGREGTHRRHTKARSDAADDSGAPDRSRRSRSKRRVDGRFTRGRRIKAGTAVAKGARGPLDPFGPSQRRSSIHPISAPYVKGGRVRCRAPVRCPGPARASSPNATAPTPHGSARARPDPGPWTR